MPAVMLPRGAEVVAPRRPAADGEDLMNLERGIFPRARNLLAQGVSDGDRRGIDDVLILDRRQDAPPIDLLGAGIR